MRRLFFVLAAVDALFIALSLLRSALDETAYAQLLLDERLYIARDGSYAEWYGYAKAGFCALVLLRLFARNRSLTLLGWALTFAFVLADDALSLHETFGAALLANASLPTVLGLPGRLYAEPLFWPLVGVPLFGLLALGYRREPRARPLTRRLLLLFAALFFFAGALDTLHAALETDYAAARYAVFLTTLLEDGGELLVLSLMVAYLARYSGLLGNARQN